MSRERLPLPRAGARPLPPKPPPLAMVAVAAAVANSSLSPCLPCGDPSDMFFLADTIAARTRCGYLPRGLGRMKSLLLRTAASACATAPSAWAHSEERVREQYSTVGRSEGSQDEAKTESSGEEAEEEEA